MKIRQIRLREGLLFIGASILPIYVFNSGGIQPSHAMLAIFAGLTILDRGIIFTPWSMLFLVLSLYCLALESFYFFGGGDPIFMINSLFLWYNFALACAVFQHVRYEGVGSLAAGIKIASAIALVTILVNGIDLRDLGDAGRSAGSFNNPNQLGFFSVCLLSLSYLFYRSGYIGYRQAFSLLTVSLLLSVLSLSKAAIISNMLVFFLALKPTAPRSYHLRFTSRVSSFIAWLAGTIIGITLLVMMFQSGAYDDLLFVERLMNMTEEGDSSMESRGYFAVFDGDAIQILFGLGTQNTEQIVGHEVHSTIGGVLNNYGLVGMAIFIAMCVLWAVKIWRFYDLVGLVCIVGPSMLYGLTHNGIRFTIFWLLFASSMAIASRRHNKKTSRARQRVTLGSADRI